MNRALLIIDYVESCCLERYEKPEWGLTLSSVRSLAAPLSGALASFREREMGQVIWIAPVPWTAERVHPNIRRLYSSNTQAEVYTDGTGAFAPYVLTPQPHEPFFEKNLYSPFSGTAGRLDSYLRGAGIDHLFVTGVYSTGCVNAAICEAFHLGYELTILRDCVETFDRESKQALQSHLLQEWGYMYGTVRSSSEIWGGRASSLFAASNSQ